MVIPAASDIIIILVAILLTYSIAIALRVGAFSLAPAALCGVAAYLSGVIALELGASVPVAMLAGVVGVTLLAALLAFPLGRSRGIHTALMSVSIVVVATAVETSLDITGGSLGLSVPFADLLLPGVVVVVATVVVFRWLDFSSLGRRMAVVQQDEELATALGIRSSLLRFGAFCASGLLAALAGVLYAHSLFFISPTDFSFAFAVTLAIYVIVSGFEHWLTPLLGAGLLALVSVSTPNLGAWSIVIQGALAAAVAVLYPRGLAGLLRRVRYRARSSMPGTAKDAATAVPDLPSAERGRTGASLDVESVGMQFGGVVALRGVSFSVSGPGCLGIIGPNGSGKSTLMNVISGTLRPTDGSVAMTGRDDPGAGGVTVGRCFQQPRLVTNLRVWENIILNERGGTAALRSRALDLGRQVGLTSRELDAWPADISTGNQRKVELARALVNDPDVLLLDEPAAGLSEDEVRGFVTVVRAAIATHLVLIVEHNLSVIHELADEVLLLVGGEVIERGPVEEMRRSQAVARAYLGSSADGSTITPTTQDRASAMPNSLAVEESS